MTITGALIIAVTFTLVGYLTAHRRIDRLTRERDTQVILADRALEDLAAETQAHAETKRQKAEAEQAAADNLTSLRVVLDAHARDIVLDPLGSDLIPDEPLTLVKGGRHG